MHPKGGDGIANSVDPDQSLIRVCTFAQTYLSQYIELLRYLIKFEDRIVDKRAKLLNIYSK